MPFSLHPRPTTRAAGTLPATRLRRGIATGFATLALLMTAQARAEGEGAKKPKLTVEEKVHETGEVARDQVIEHAFKIRNSGDAVLTIDRAIVAPNVEVLGQPSSLAPGESGEVRVRVPLLNDKPLALAKQVELKTNDPDTPSTVLELRIFSVEYVAASPGYARWISVQKETPGKIQQRVFSRDGQDFEIQRTSELPAGITASKSATRKDPQSPREWQVDLTLAPDAPVGPIIGNLLLYVNHPKQSLVPIPLSGFMRPVIAVTPTELKLGEVKLTEMESQLFVVKSFSTEPVHVTKVEHDIQGVAPATVEARKVGRDYRIRLNLDPATTPKGKLHGTLKILTDSAKEPVISVPIELTIL